jgi:hypothetical protein
LGAANRLSEGRISAPETNSGAKSNPEIKAEASLSFMVHVSRKNTGRDTNSKDNIKAQIALMPAKA